MKEPVTLGEFLALVVAAVAVYGILPRYGLAAALLLAPLATGLLIAGAPAGKREHEAEHRTP